MRKTGVTLSVVGVIVLVMLIVFSVVRNTNKQEITSTNQEQTVVTQKTIGTSVQGRNIDLYEFGNGSKHVAFVGGIHGGYEWNSVLLAYTFIDYLTAHPETIPANLTIDVIPSANPDAVYKVTGKEGRFTASDVSTDQDLLASARFNADKVDLNRNFDCKWNPKSTWRSQTVSGGTSAFSEPETQAIRNYIEEYNPVAAVFWHSQSNAVYASQCEHGILPETLTIMNTYATSAGYPAVKTFDAYSTTGAADDWLASINIPAITVELSTHNDIEWNKNLLGIQALINYFK